MARETKQISTFEFTKDVTDGMTRSQLMEKYGLNKVNINKIAKQLNLEIKREVKPVFNLI